MKGTNEKWTKSQNKFPRKSCQKCGLSPLFNWCFQISMAVLWKNTFEV